MPTPLTAFVLNFSMFVCMHVCVCVCVSVFFHLVTEFSFVHTHTGEAQYGNARTADAPNEPEPELDLKTQRPHGPPDLPELQGANVAKVRAITYARATATRLRRTARETR